MPQVYPRITYSPEGMLELRADFGEHKGAERVQEAVENVDSKLDYVLSEHAGEFIVQASVPEQVVDLRKEPARAHGRYEQIINDLSVFTYYDSYDSRDLVFSLKFWRAYGATGVVHPHMQRWMNAGLFDEDLGNEVFDAIALPWGPSYSQSLDEYDRRFYQHAGSTSVGSGGLSIGVELRNSEFKVKKVEDINDESKELYDQVTWRTPLLTTLGSCACWSATHEDRMRYFWHPERAGLYEMTPHNVDTATQSLSLVLGMGRLAFEAVQYSGEEDIMAGVEWAK